MIKLLAIVIALLASSIVYSQVIVTPPHAIPMSYLDTDTALTSNSDTKVSSQKAIKTYVDTIGAVAVTGLHYFTSQAESALTNEVNLGALTTGILKITVAGGVATPSSVTAPSGTIVGTSDLQTLSNKRITPRAIILPSNDATLTSANAEYNIDTADEFLILALAQDTDFGVPNGTPVQGQKIIIRIKDDGTARALTWNAVYVPIGVVLPATTVISKLLYISAIYNATSSQWDVLGVSQEQ